MRVGGHRSWRTRASRSARPSTPSRYSWPRRRLRRRACRAWRRASGSTTRRGRAWRCECCGARQHAHWGSTHQPCSAWRRGPACPSSLITCTLTVPLSFVFPRPPADHPLVRPPAASRSRPSRRPARPSAPLRRPSTSAAASCWRTAPRCPRASWTAKSTWRRWPRRSARSLPRRWRRPSGRAAAAAAAAGRAARAGPPASAGPGASRVLLGVAPVLGAGVARAGPPASAGPGARCHAVKWKGCTACPHRQDAVAARELDAVQATHPRDQASNAHRCRSRHAAHTARSEDLAGLTHSLSPERPGTAGRRRGGNANVGAWSARASLRGLSGGDGGGGSKEDRVAKLAYADVRRSAVLKEALSRHFYAQFPFAPDINPRSRVIGKVRDKPPTAGGAATPDKRRCARAGVASPHPSVCVFPSGSGGEDARAASVRRRVLLPPQAHTVEDLHRNETGRVARQRVAEQLQQEEVEECTFSPALNPVSLAVAAARRSGSLLDGVTAKQLLQVRTAACTAALSGACAGASGPTRGVVWALGFASVLDASGRGGRSPKRPPYAC